MKSTEGSQKANGLFLRCQQRNGSSRREYMAGSALLPSVVEALVLRDVGIVLVFINHPNLTLPIPKSHRQQHPFPFQL